MVGTSTERPPGQVEGLRPVRLVSKDFAPRRPEEDGVREHEARALREGAIRMSSAMRS